MKKYFLTLLILGLSVLLFGCGASTKETGSTETPQTETAETDTEDTNTKAPDNEEMDIIFNEAYEVYQWFELDKLEVESDENGLVMYEIGDSLYGKVADSRISEICNQLLSEGLYIEENGVLYQLPADRGSDITRGEILSQGVTERTDNAVTYTVTVETYDPSVDAVTGSEEIPFLYENIDGKWVFTRFQSIY